MDQATYNKLVEAFEYEHIDSWTDGETVIEWNAQEQTCFEYCNGELVTTGSFARLLEWFVEETA